MANCYSCGTPLPDTIINSGPGQTIKVGFRESCQKCLADLHCCKNCQFYSTNSYNECSEPSAERVVDKEKFNRCDYFVFNSATTKAAGEDKAAAARKKLDDLFK